MRNIIRYLSKLFGQSESVGTGALGARQCVERCTLFCPQSYKGARCNPFRLDKIDNLGTTRNHANGRNFGLDKLFRIRAVIMQTSRHFGQVEGARYEQISQVSY